MRTRFLSLFFGLLTVWMLAPMPAPAAVYHHRRHYHSYRHRAHVRTARRIGVGAVGGAVVGALAGGGPGAAIGAVAGGATGYAYDRYKKHHHHE